MSIKKHIPNAVTCMNLVCGVLGIVFTIQGHLDYGLYAMLCAALFDFCDGFAARALKAGSEFGKQLDSLSDVITFGLLPGLMFSIYMVMGNGAVHILAFIPLLLPLFAALRLAKFNVDEAQGKGFLGLPTPASALLCGCLIWFVYGHPSSFLAEWAGGPVFLPVLSVVLCALMVSRIPMFSLKFTASTPKKPIIIVAAAIVVVVVVLLCLGMHISLIATILLTLYPLYNIIRALFSHRKK